MNPLFSERQRRRLNPVFDSNLVSPENEERSTRLNAGLSQTWPARMVTEPVKAIANFIRHTGDVYAGRADAGDVTKPWDFVSEVAGLAPATAVSGAAGALGGNLGGKGGLGGLGGQPIQLRGSDTPGVISTRLPTAKKATEDPFTDYLPIDTAAIRAEPKMFEHNAGLFNDPTNYPGVTSAATRRSSDPERAVKEAKDTGIGNLLFLHDLMPEHIRERSKLWYEGANRIASDMSKEYGMPTNSVAGVLAALSPQKDWYQNVSLGERVLGTMANPKQAWTPEMEKTVGRIYGDPKFEPLVKNIRGRSLADLTDPTEKAAWIRAYDEAHNPRSHRIVNPEGTFGGPVLSANKTPSGTGWGSLVEISKAVNAAESGGDAKLLSELMGERHKVRNFFNNILAPNARTGDVTIDTHAVAADLLQPLSGNTIPVAHNFKNSLAKNFIPETGFVNAKGSAGSGAQGTYGIHADAYREAAAERGILPREMQSITWEGVRGLFPDTFKTKGNMDLIRNIWAQVDAGQMTQAEARKAIAQASGGMRLPTWAQ